MKSSGEAQWGEIKRGRGAVTALDTFQRAFKLKAACLHKHAKVGGHKLCGGDDFYTSLSDHNMVIERGAHEY